MFIAEVSASGGAVVLKWLEVTNQEVLILCTPTPTPPTTPLTPPPTARVVVNAQTPVRVIPAPFTVAEHPKRQYRAYLDMFKGDYSQKAVRLLETQAVTYHLYRIVGGVPQAPQSITVDARAPRTTVAVPITRDAFKTRIEYHLARAVATDAIRPAQGATEIPVLERDTLAENDPFPCVLFKESISQGEQVVGNLQGAKTNPEGQTVITRVFRYNVRYDLLVLALNSDDRTFVAKEIHEGLLIDYPLLDQLGLGNTTISRNTNSAADNEGHFHFGEEITVQATFEVRSTETQIYRVAPPLTTRLL